MKTETSIATVTIKHASDMTPRERADLARWLRRHADMVQRDGAKYAGRFTGRYLAK